MKFNKIMLTLVCFAPLLNILFDYFALRKYPSITNIIVSAVCLLLYVFILISWNKFEELETVDVITTSGDVHGNDNDVSFENTDEHTTMETEPTTSKHISETETTLPESPTDSDGWIDRWY